MELTNLLWHLGALIAALWAGFSYRAMLFRQQELEAGVLVSLLLTQANSASTDTIRPSPRHLSLLRSARVRALSWFTDEFARRHGCVLAWCDRDGLVGLSDEQWRCAVAGLYELLQRPQQLKSQKVPLCTLHWQILSSGGGQWSVSSDKGAVDVEQ